MGQKIKKLANFIIDHFNGIQGPIILSDFKYKIFEVFKTEQFLKYIIGHFSSQDIYE